jgi:hypothetical protein
MRITTAPPVPRLLLVGLLAIGWLIGFAVHGSMAAATGWGDISPLLMLWGVALCALAGGVAWAVAPAHRRMLIGALAGLGMFASFVVGNLLVVALWVDPAHMAESGESWFSLLLESWFWIGLPTLVSGALGASGWSIARRLASSGSHAHA